MLDRFRVPLLVVSAALMVWGAALFWQGKATAESGRKNRKPLAVTRDALLTNPPTKAITWVTITDGAAPLPRAILMDYDSAGKNAPFYLYVPIVSKKEAAASFSVRQITKEKPQFVVMLRSQNPAQKVSYNTMKQIQSAPTRTTDAWLAQNRDPLTLRPPFTGLLVRRSLDPYNRLIAESSGFAPDAYVLWENAKPPLVTPAPLAVGLALLMGVPTVWLFALIITGKFDPSDDAPSTGDSTTAPAETIATATLDKPTIPAPSGSVMPSAPPEP